MHETFRARLCFGNRFSLDSVEAVALKFTFGAKLQFSINMQQDEDVQTHSAWSDYLEATDTGAPALTRYQRVTVRVR